MRIGEPMRAVERSALVLALVLVLAPAPAGGQQFSSYQRSATYVTMKDGTRLAVDVVLPTGWTGSAPAPSRFPVVFRYTPYGRSYLDLKSGRVIVDEFYPRHGYAFVSADMRGTGGSFGWMNMMDPRVRDDGKELVDWIAAQPWSSGKVGMRGGSYEGWSQLAVASKAPKALKAIIPEHAGWDGFLMHPGGIYSYAFMQIWTALTYHLNRSSVFTPFPIPPTPPVVDEDGDGEIADEIPLDLNHNGWFSDDYRWPISSGPAPQYADGVVRTHHYYLDAVLQHIADPAGAPGTFDGDPVTSAQRFWDTKRPGDGLTSPDANWAWAPDVMKSGVAIMGLAGWFDAFVEGTFQVFATMRHALPSRLVARPVYHQGVSQPFATSVGLPTKAAEQPLADRMEELRWFDHWLKGIDNGVEREPPVKLFVMNDGWRTATSWPLPGAKPVRFFLQGEHRLSNQAKGSAGADSYRADFSHYGAWDPPLPAAPIAEVDSLLHRSAPPIEAFRRNRQFMFGVPEGPPVRTTLDQSGLSYTTAPLARNTDVIGHPIVHLFASSTADDGDFYLYLEDVDPSGQAVLVTEYQHRAGFSRLRSANEVIPGNRGIQVRPALPWHGYREADYDPHVFANGKVAAIVTALYPTAWRFKAGHSIRLTIESADWPTFELHPNLSPSNRPNAPDNIVPTVTVHRGGVRASYVELPIN